MKGEKSYFLFFEHIKVCRAQKDGRVVQIEIVDVLLEFFFRTKKRGLGRKRGQGGFSSGTEMLERPARDRIFIRVAVIGMLSIRVRLDGGALGALGGASGGGGLLELGKEAAGDRTRRLDHARRKRGENRVRDRRGRGGGRGRGNGSLGSHDQYVDVATRRKKVGKKEKEKKRKAKKYGQRESKGAKKRNFTPPSESPLSNVHGNLEENRGF